MHNEFQNRKCQYVARARIGKILERSLQIPDFFLQRHAKFPAHALFRFRGERQDVFSRRAACVHDEIRMFLGNNRASHALPF